MLNIDNLEWVHIALFAAALLFDGYLLVVLYRVRKTVARARAERRAVAASLRELEYRVSAVSIQRRAGQRL